MNALVLSFRTPHFEFRICPGRWFLTQIKEIVDFEEELAGAKKKIFSERVENL
jgi:hypothetical protein